jgi:hypothetical protein
MNHKKYLQIAALVSITFLTPIIFIKYKNPVTQNVPISDLRCPDDYKTVDEATVAMNVFTNNFFDAHPSASLTEWGNARYQFYIDHHCTAAIQRYDQAQAGKADKATMDKIDKSINAIPIKE